MLFADFCFCFFFFLIICYTEIKLFLYLSTSVCQFLQVTVQSRVTAQKPNLSVCVQAPLAVTCDQFVFNDLGKFLQHRYRYFIILLFLKMFERYHTASIKCIVGDTAVQVVTNVPYVHSADFIFCLLKKTKIIIQEWSCFLGYSVTHGR